MPTYEYVCPDGHEFEKFQKISQRPGARCPECGKAATRRISGGAGLVFKGTGFYITDYGKDGKGPRKAPAESAGESGAGASASKPDAAAAPSSQDKAPKAPKAPKAAE